MRLRQLTVTLRHTPPQHWTEAYERRNPERCCAVSACACDIGRHVLFMLYRVNKVRSKLRYLTKVSVYAEANLC